MSCCFSFRLRMARETRWLTQLELANLSGLQESAISHFEKGRREPSLENFVKLKDALMISADELLVDYMSQKQALRVTQPEDSEDD